MTRKEKLKKVKEILKVKSDSSIANILNCNRKRIHDYKYEKCKNKNIDIIFDLIIENHELKECFVFNRGVSCNIKYKKYLKAKYSNTDLQDFSYRVVK